MTMKKFLFLFVFLFSFPAQAVCPVVTEGGEEHQTCDQTFDGDVLFNGSVSIPGGITDPSVVKQTTADMTLYVRTTGSDSNDGLTTGTALLTPQEAVNRVPKYIRHAVVIDIGEGDFNGAYLAGFAMAGTNPSFLIKGVLGNPTLATGTTSGTADGGGTRDVVDSGQGWTPDELIGYLALVGTDYRVIYANDATSFNVVAAYGSSTSGKAYEILDQKTNINVAETVTGYGGLTFRGNLQKIKVNDIKMTGIMIGVCNMYTPAPAEPERCRFNANTYGGVFVQASTQEFETKHCAAVGCAKGFYIVNGSSVRSMNGCLAYNSTGAGFYFQSSLGTFENGDVASISNGTNGYEIQGCDVGNVDFNYVVFSGNTKNGISIGQVPNVQLDGGGVIDGNGEYGIVVGDTAVTNFAPAAGVVIPSSFTISNNTLGGIRGMNHAVISLQATTGTNAGPYGLVLETGANAFITSATAITGATGDATIDGATTTLTWATDFATDGDTNANVTYGTRIERKD